jgi:uncharacterized protein (DUF427 family)
MSDVPARPPHADPPAPGQESVWDYPRPPRIERSARRVRVLLGEVVLADSTGAWRVLETSHPPTYYLPPDDVRCDLLTPAPQRGSWCEWKGQASYWDARAGELVVEAGAWSYPHPTPGFAALAGAVAFYPARFACFLDDERVAPQPGGFYGGWVTTDLVGPFKGGPGTSGW